MIHGATSGLSLTLPDAQIRQTAHISDNFQWNTDGRYTSDSEFVGGEAGDHRSHAAISTGDGGNGHSVQNRPVRFRGIPTRDAAHQSSDTSCAPTVPFKLQMSSWDPDADPYECDQFIEDPSSFEISAACPDLILDSVEKLPEDKLPFTKPLNSYGLEEFGVVAVLIGAIASVYFSFTKHGGGMNASDLAEVATGLAGGGFELASLAYSRKTHKREEVLTREIFEKEKRLTEEYHKRDRILAHTLQRRDQTLAKKMHMIQMNNNMIQNQIQLASDLSLAVNESLRDMYDASNQKLQTLILSSTVMFAALSTVVVQGQLPVPQVASPAVIWFMSVVGTLSFGFLFMAIVISIELLNETSQLMWKMAINHHSKLQELMNEMDEVDIKPEANEDTNTSKAGWKFRPWSCFKRHNRAVEKRSSFKKKPVITKSRILNITDPKNFQDSWLNHEEKMQGKLEKIAEHRREFKKDTQSLKKNLTVYWHKVQQKTRLADICFYSGTVMMLACMVDYLFAKFTETYSDDMYDPHLTGWAIMSIMTFFVAISLLYVFIERMTSESTVSTVISSISMKTDESTPRPRAMSQQDVPCAGSSESLAGRADSCDSLANLVDSNDNLPNFAEYRDTRLSRSES